MTADALIQPTGEEIRCGIVADTDSPMIRAQLERLGFRVTVAPVVDDVEDAIACTIRRAGLAGYGLMVLIGGSGGGHRHDPSLTHDLTHTAMDRLLSDGHATALYGKNGHLWSRLVCGRLGEMLVVNVPGPFQEAQAAIRAFSLLYLGEHTELKALNAAMAAAVCETYETLPPRGSLRP